MFCGGLPIVSRTPLMESPLLSTTSVIGIDRGGFSGHMLWYDRTQRRDSSRGVRYAIWRYEIITAAKNFQVYGFVRHIWIFMIDLAKVRYDCKVQHASSRLTISIISAALRHRLKMIIGAELSVYAGVRRSSRRRFHGY
jgi:hypothetical protein